VLNAKRSERAVGPLLPINGLNLLSNDPAARPVIGHVLPTPPVMMQTQQGSGPDPDTNLTATSTAPDEYYPSASPGSTQNRIVFCSYGVDADADGQIDPTLPADPDLNIWIMRSDGSEQYQVADLPGDQVDPVYDPGGRLICYSSQVNGTWQIFTLEVRDPRILTQITTGAGNKRHPSWSPDSNWISFQCDVNGDWDIYKIDSTGAGSPIPLTFGPSVDTDPAWSTTGFLIAFTRTAGGISRIFTVTPDGADVEQLSDGGGSALVNDKQPAWRQNSTELAFASDRFIGAGDTTRDFNIWRMPPTGELGDPAASTIVSNTSLADTADDTDPAYTQEIAREPTRVVFTSDRAGSSDIWAMQMRDWIAPVLEDLPETYLPNGDPDPAVWTQRRIFTPGDDVMIAVPVYDADSGVQRVTAYIKDPDRKQYLVYGTTFDSSPFAGQRSLEIDCATIGNVELLDDDGDGVFSGDWTSQSIASGRDYIIDIEVLDVAGNVQRYDDVYGFSTRQFSPVHNILFVDDYCEGQLFLAQLGFDNDFAASWPVESYWTSNPSAVLGLEDTIDFDTIQDAYGDGYDTWRIICRGPIPPAVYQYYLPTTEYQLDPANLDTEGSIGVVADRAVPVADRAVVWAAPHTGNVWIAEGGIMDASTQADVALFVQRGGRLFLAGEDIAWALTMNGTRANSFLTNTLRARFVSDTIFSGGTLTYNWLGRTFRIQRTSTGFDVTGLGGDVVADDPWGSGHAGDLGSDNWLDAGDNPVVINTSWNSIRPTSEPSDYHDCADWSVRPDAIEVLNAIQIYTGTPGTATTPAVPVGLRYRSLSPTEGTVVFLSCGFEQLNRGYHQPSPLPPHCRNVRSHLMHNAMCWSRTGGFQGRVVSISEGGKAINDPAPIVSARQGGQIRYAVRCQRDGTYVMQGLPPGYYDIEAVRPGYEIDHYMGEYVHGGQIPRVIDFAIKRSQPGAVTGQVTSAATGDPLANVTVSVAGDPNGTFGAPLPDPVLTAADGTYTLPYVPSGDYIITANGAAILYGTEDLNVTVTPGDTAVADFALDAANGTIEATVTDATTSDPIRNAAVVIVSVTGTRTTVYTDDAGVATAPLAPGTYTVTASASGFQPSTAQTAMVTPAATVNLAFALQPQPGGAIAGRVVTAGTGVFISGVNVHVFFGDEEIATATTSGTAVTTIGGVQYNYQIPDVPTGEMRVTAERSGFSSAPTERTVQIESGVTSTNVNFAMDSLHTFPRGLQLVSFPWDFSGVDPAVLLGIGTSTWKMATWEAARQRYAMYPEAPADRFRIGTGYWMNLTNMADLSQEGLAATDPVELPLDGGWNLIGCPYNRRIDFYTANVRQSGVVRTLQQALSEGIIGSAPYVYILGGYQTTGVLSPYTGYWLRTNMPCSLILSETAGALAVGKQTPDASPHVNDGWLLQLKTRVGAVQDSATYLGWSRDATDGCDFALDQLKPPTPAMGSYVYTAIDNRDWAQNGGDYAVDVRPSDVSATWNLTVYTNQAGQRVTVSWDDLSRLPRDVQPYLVDVQTGRRVYVRTTTGYTFEAGDQPRRLQVVVGAAGVGQLAISPQAAAQTNAGFAISYTLSRAAEVQAVITNIAGRPVQQLGGSMQAAGLNTLLWDGRDGRGLRAPNGRYLVTVVGRTETGQECRAILPLDIRSR